MRHMCKSPSPAFGRNSDRSSCIVFCPLLIINFPSSSLFRIFCRRYPGRFEDLEREFGREYTQLSRLYGEAIDYIEEHHIHRITNYLDYWRPCFQTMADYIEAKGKNIDKVFAWRTKQFLL